MTKESQPAACRDSSKAPKRFRGWIPTISGRLSFSVFGQNRHPTEVIFANVADEKIRYLAAYQFRDASDVLLPFRSQLSPFLLGIDGRLWFAFVANTETASEQSQHVLTGRAFLFTDRKTWCTSIRPAIEDYQQYLRQFLFIRHGDLRAYATNGSANLVDVCTKMCSFFADIKICRTGTTDVSFAYPLTLPENAPKLPDDPVKLDHILQIIASQLFFFLKDMGHRHQHHDPTTDQIVLLHHTAANDDLSWRNNTLYGMYRNVIEIKRDPHISTFSDALGLIAYAESFAAISEEELGTGSSGKLPIYYANHTKDSIKSTQSRVERYFARKQRITDIARNTIISVASVLFSFMGLLKLSNYESTVTPNWLLTKSLDWILLHPLPALATLGLGIYVLTQIFSMQRGEISLRSIRIIRAVNFLPRLVVVGSLVLFAALSLLVFWTLLP